MARILIVEDSPELRELLVLVLEDEGHEVAAFRSPREALNALRLEGCHLILSDLVDETSENPGEEDLAWLAEAVRYARVLVITGRAWAARVSARELGVDALLPKPFEIEQLLDRVNLLIPTSE